MAVINRGGSLNMEIQQRGNTTAAQAAALGGAVVSTNKVLRDTYRLLSASLLFSAAAAMAAIVLRMGAGLSLLCMLGGFIMLFVVHKNAHSARGIPALFVFTGLFGAALGPILRNYLSLPQGPSIVMQALGGTGIIFLGLSAYAQTTRRDFSYLGGFLFVGLLVAVVAIIANLFLQIPALSLAISAVVVMIMSGLILYDTKRILDGGETNYIIATMSMYLNIFNLFIHLLHLIAAFTSND